MEETSDLAINTAQRAKRYHQLEWIVIVCTVLILVLGFTLGMVAIERQSVVVDTSKHTDCVARLEAAYVLAIGDAFAAPPAPNASRSEAVKQIRIAGKKLRNLDGNC